MAATAKLFLLTLFSLALAACQTTENRRGDFAVDEIQQLAVELDRFNVGIGPEAHNIPIFPLDSWYYVSDIYLFISDGRQGAFLVTFWTPCPETELAINLAVNMSGTMLNAEDYIIPISTSGSLTDCRIKEINSLLPRAADENAG